MIKKALLIQIRDDKKIAAQEYKSFLRLAKKAGVSLSKVNACYQNLPLANLLKKYDAFLIGGSEFSVERMFPKKAKVNTLIQKVIKDQKPFLGICFGFQLLIEVMGGKIIKTEKTKEFGTVSIAFVKKQEKILNNLPHKLIVQQAHYWGCFKNPKNTELLSVGKNSLIQGIKVKNAMAYGFQFHPELTRKDMIDRMKLYNQKNNSSYKFSTEDMKKIKQSVLSEQVITNFLANY